MDYKKKYLKYKLKYLKLKKGGGDSVNNNLTIPEIEIIQESLENNETIQNLLLQLGQEEYYNIKEIVEEWDKNDYIETFYKIDRKLLEKIIQERIDKEDFERARLADAEADIRNRRAREAAVFGNVNYELPNYGIEPLNDRPENVPMESNR